MKNLKKILALALVFAFSLTLFAGAAFTDDADIGDEYKDDVSMLVELKIIGGYPEGDFRPNGNITRAEFCKMVYTLMYGADSDGSLFGSQASKFNDVGEHWAKGYINYCANQNIVGGYGDGTFKPDGNITVAEVSKMLLVLLGCDPAKEGFGGSNWIGNVVSKAMALGVYDGWVGNATELAIRQLVAKLMRNTIFAPVYRYNAFTGAGSQYNMDNEENKTLGETVMGLIHITGLVVANENFSIDSDEDGELLVDLGVSIPTPTEDYSYVLYYTEDNDAKLLKVDRALDDTMLGCLVDVYFRAKGNENNYSQVEVIGNVLLNAKTKAYDVLSKDIEMYPNEKRTARTVPYIAFNVDGVEKRIKARKADTESGVYDGRHFVNISYVCNDSVSVTESSDLEHPKPLSEDPQDTQDLFFANMGENSIARYRIVSVDGGNTYSYIFKFHNNEQAFRLGTVTSYNESRNSISVTNIGTRDLDDVILHGDVDRDDTVIMYRLNGKLNLGKVDIITGRATIKGKDYIVIDGNEYAVDFSLFTSSTANTISEYFSENRGASEAGTQYYVYNDVIVDIDPAASVSNVSDYAVVLNSTYDVGLDAAYVKLAFADNTEGTYEVSRFWQPYRNQMSHPDNDLPSRFQYNEKLGWIYKYRITSDGKVDLGIDEGIPVKTDEQNYTFKVDGAAFVVEDGSGGSSRFNATSNSVVFFLYGKLGYTDGKPNDDNVPIKAKAYKLKELDDTNVVPDVGGYGIELPALGQPPSSSSALAFGNWVEDTRGGMRNLVLGAMSFGDKAPKIIADTDACGYVVDIDTVFNTDTNDWYLNVKLINEDGLQELQSVDSYDDASGTITEVVNSINNNPLTTEYVSGTIAVFRQNSEGLLTSFDVESGKIENMARPIEYNGNVIADGFYYATVVSMSSELLGFYEYRADEPREPELETGRLAPADEAVSLHDDYIGVITIRDNEDYAGDYLVTHSIKQRIPAGYKNAIIQFIDSGKVLRIFSFEE